MNVEVPKILKLEKALEEKLKEYDRFNNISPEKTNQQVVLS
jgi:hypothetical protein